LGADGEIGKKTKEDKQRGVPEEKGNTISSKRLAGHQAARAQK